MSNQAQATEPAEDAQAYPRHIETMQNASYWEMEDGRYQATPPNMRPSVDNGAGYANLEALKRLKNDKS